MKSFQIRDLTVTLGTTAQNPYGGVCHRGCSVFISPICYFGCSFQISPCPWHNSMLDCFPGTRPPFTDTFRDPTIIERELPDLKKAELEELRSNLAALQNKVEMQIRQTPEDLDLIEGKLKEALADIENQRKYQQ